MAEVKKSETGFTVDATNQYVLGNQQSLTMNRMVITLIFTGFTGSVVIMGRPQGRTSVAGMEIPYKPRYLNGAVSDEIPVSTAIDDDSIIDVDASGLDILIDATVSAGSFVVHYDKLKG